MNQLLREFVRARRLAETPVLKPILEKVGLVDLPRHWGVDWVEVDGGLYRPADEGGRVALIVGVYQLGGLIDLVATSLETRAMRRRKGLGTLLGEDRVDDAMDNGTSLPVFSDGISWVTNECRGVVILDWHDAYDQLADVPSMTCETEALAVRIRQAFADRICQVPPLFIPDVQTKDRRHAA